MNIRPIYVELAARISAMANCLKEGNEHWYGNHGLVIDEIMKTGPTGSGVDTGLQLMYDKSKTDHLVIAFGYHHMSETGFYEGWTDHELVITPSLHLDYLLRITGQDRNNIKEYLNDIFSAWLSATVEISYKKPADKHLDYPTARIQP